MSVERINSELKRIGLELIKNPYEFSFVPNKLPKADYEVDILKDDQLKPLFDNLNKRTSHCLYWFSVGTHEAAYKMNNLLDDSREKLISSKRKVPAKNKTDYSDVLYVGRRVGGIRKRDNLTFIAGRMVIHFGYYEKGSTQGMQFAHWARTIDQEIKISVVELNSYPQAYLNALEHVIAHELKPLCGLHR